MRLHRFYIEQEIPQEGEITLADPELIHQMVNVFRFKISDKVILFDGRGSEFEAEIMTTSKKEISFKILKSSQGVSSALGGDSLASKNVSLYLALIKKGNFELAVEKCTEVGVAEIHPIISERSEKKDLNIERLNKIVKEASEQSGRLTLPKVYDVKSLEEAVTQVVNEGKVCVAFDPGGEKHNLVSQDNIAIFVGPEGGWSDAELDVFKKNKFKTVSIGENVLRAETAAIVGSSLLLIL
jgi:16S rRNA (uracil1498-N3)-methyltransferase